jgi:tyrosine-protein kinase Etk/Wzc
MAGIATVADRPVTALIGAGSGLMLGIALSWWTHPTRSRITERSRLDAAFPVLGAPFASDAELRKLPPDRRTPLGLALERPMSEYSRSMRDALAALDRVAPPGREGAVLPVTGAQPRVGATTLAASLAFVAAATGRRTLLIDADLSTAGATGLFDLDPHTGIHEAAIGAAGLAQAAKPLAAYGVDFSAVTDEARGRELYSAVMWGSVLDQARSSYALILIDAPPALLSAGSRMLARTVDGVVIAARRGKTPELAVKSTVRALGRAKSAPIKAAVLTDAAPKKGARAGRN